MIVDFEVIIFGCCFKVRCFVYIVMLLRIYEVLKFYFLNLLSMDNW